MSLIEFRRTLRERAIAARKDYNPGEKVTQPDLSRTIRQILRDTVEGRPSPTELPAQPFDSERFKTTDVDKLHNLSELSNDKFEALDQARAKVKQSESDVKKKQQELQDAEKQMVKDRRLQETAKLKEDIRREMSAANDEK